MSTALIPIPLAKDEAGEGVSIDAGDFGLYSMEIIEDTARKISDAVLVAEGYATAASVHEATGRPVAVAFDAGNLAHVARALRQRLPAVHLVLCGDDDAATKARTGRNTGREKAEAAARAVQGVAVFPAGLPEGGSDFNDLHLALGLNAVRDQMEAAIAGLSESSAVGQATVHADAVDPEEELAAAATPKRKRARRPEGTAGQVDTPSESLRADPFTCDAQGVWFHGRDREGNPARPMWVCSQLAVAALTRDQEGGGWGYLLEFFDPMGRPKSWAMPARMLSGDGGEYRAALLGMGLRIGAGASARNRLTEYIQTRQPSEFATCTDRIGWHVSDGQAAYVLPHETIGDQAERIVFQSDSQMENTFRVRGQATEWRDRVGRLCAGNSRLVFAVACAFAGPLLRLTNTESGGFHLRGDSSSGKTTALRVAASVFGGPSYMQRWRTTDNALEAIAAQHCDALLILDELAQVEGRVAGECAYMLANEQSKARATRNAAPRPRLSWRLLFLSAGELGLADHMADGMKRTRVGQEVRMADIPADAGAGLGAFETIHDFAGGAAYASHLARETASCYGASGRAWLAWACENAGGLGKRVRMAVNELTRVWAPDGASGQVSRVAARFALVGAAGALATAAGLTGWPVGESERAARACFDAWLRARGGAGNGEVTAMLRQVKSFIEVHGASRFGWLHRGADDHAPSPLMRAGWRRMLNASGEPIKTNSQFAAEHGQRGEYMPNGGEGVAVEYLITPEVFRSEVCKGYDHVAVCKVLLEHECLSADSDGRMTRKTRIPGVGSAVNCYCIPPRILGLEL